jgi:hypothetical protein
VRLFLTAITSFGFVFIASCLDLGGCSDDEVARVTDPGGSVDAVLFERNCGATTSFSYRVYVVSRGSRLDPATESAAAYLYGAGRSDSASGANLRWTADELRIEYLQAREATVRDSTVHVGTRDIRVVLEPGIADIHAPGGGMLYNLRGRQR